MSHVYLHPDGVWDFYLDCCQEKWETGFRNEMVLLAENEDTDVSVYLMASEDASLLVDGRYTLPMICVVKEEHGEPVCAEIAISKRDCSDIVSQYYSQYLGANADEPHSQDEVEDLEAEVEEMIEMREDELHNAFLDFLEVVRSGDPLPDDEESLEEFSEFEEEVLDFIFAYLAEEHGVEVFRPVLTKDEETGKAVCIEYPYDPVDPEGYYIE